MGRKKRKGPSMAGIFKAYYQEHPEWLTNRDNAATLARFAIDHPAIEITQRIKQAMFNAKNYLNRGSKRGTRGGPRKIARIQAAVANPLRRAGAMQMLENHIDDCLAMAKQLGRDDIGDVINHLHRARNILVIKIES